MAKHSFFEAFIPLYNYLRRKTFIWILFGSLPTFFLSVLSVAQIFPNQFTYLFNSPILVFLAGFFCIIISVLTLFNNHFYSKIYRRKLKEHHQKNLIAAREQEATKVNRIHQNEIRILQEIHIEEIQEFQEMILNFRFFQEEVGDSQKKIQSKIVDYLDGKTTILFDQSFLKERLYEQLKVIKKLLSLQDTELTYDISIAKMGENHISEFFGESVKSFSRSIVGATIDELQHVDCLFSRTLQKKDFLIVLDIKSQLDIPEGERCFHPINMKTGWALGMPIYFKKGEKGSPIIHYVVSVYIDYPNFEDDEGYLKDLLIPSLVFMANIFALYELSQKFSNQKPLQIPSETKRSKGNVPKSN